MKQAIHYYSDADDAPVLKALLREYQRGPLGKASLTSLYRESVTRSSSSITTSWPSRSAPAATCRGQFQHEAQRSVRTINLKGHACGKRESAGR